MRLIVHSNAPWNRSAYGKQTALLVPRLAALGHEIAAIAAPYTFGGTVLEHDGIPVIPCARDTAGTDVFTANYEHFKADLCITLCDPFGLMKCAEDMAKINVAMHFPVDCNPLGEGDVYVLRESQAIPVAMSQFGTQVLRSEGCDPLYAPHCVDTGIYRPGDKMAFRDTVPGIGPDSFVVGMVAMNRDLNRKGWGETLLAFSRFHARHPDSWLALHTSPVNNPGLNLKAMAERLGIGAVTTWPDSYCYDLGIITEEQMAIWYNGLDILSLCSYGEGFGLPLIEAQACAVPVVTTDASAMSELCGGGWLVSGTPFWAPGHNAWWKRPDADDIEAAYEAAYQAREDGTLPKKPAHDFAQLYEADRVFGQHWVPVMKELEERIGYSSPAAAA